jgi:hypothetical protein
VKGGRRRSQTDRSAYESLAMLPHILNFFFFF